MRNHVDGDRWLSVNEIALYLGVSKESIYRWCEKDLMPGHKLGRQWKFKTSEVDEWVRKKGKTLSQSEASDEI